MDDKEALKNLVVSFYSDLFKSDEAAGGSFTKGAFPIVDPSTWDGVEREVTKEEIVYALRGMGLYKIPCLNGF